MKLQKDILYLGLLMAVAAGFIVGALISQIDYFVGGLLMEGVFLSLIWGFLIGNDDGKTAGITAGWTFGLMFVISLSLNLWWLG